MLNGKNTKSYLDRIISELDAGRTPRRPSMPFWVRTVAGPAAVGLAVGLGACAIEHPDRDITKDEARAARADGYTDDLCADLGAEAGCDLCAELDWYDDGVCDDFCPSPDGDCVAPLYAAPVEDCANGRDDDGDGLVDCDDDDCSTSSDCVYPILPPAEETDCTDGLDDDGDGLVDCDDPDCADAVGECIFPIMPPPGELDCSNGLDDDGDGFVDCADPDCASSIDCPTPAYAAPYEICDNRADDDGDGFVDCGDPDCDGFAGCGPAPEYAAPFEDCTNGVDDDGDGLVDCDDPDCGCATPLYAAPV